MRRRGSILLAISAALLLVTTTAFAADIRITDQGGTITIHVCDFEGGITVNGSSVDCFGDSSPVGDVTFPDTTTITFAGSWVDGDQTLSGTQAIYFIEPTDLTHVSDILSFTYSISNNIGTINGSFVSEESGPLGPLPAGATTWNEGLGTWSGGVPNLSLSAFSEAATIPEPATLLLMGAGLLFLGRKLRK